MSDPNKQLILSRFFEQFLTVSKDLMYNMLEMTSNIFYACWEQSISALSLIFSADSITSLIP